MGPEQFFLLNLRWMRTAHHTMGTNEESNMSVR